MAELEGQLKKQEESTQPSVQKTPDLGLDQSFRSDTSGNDQFTRWYRGIWTAESHTGQMQYFGPSSSFFFINEIRSHLEHVLQIDHLDISFLPTTASKVFASPASASRRNDIVQSQGLGEDFVIGEDLTRLQEEYFLNMFWQLYHCTIPILDHGAFKEHYDSLWSPSPSQGLYRRPSALADIVLALSIQYGTASMAYGQSKTEIDGEDCSIGGRWFYHRCQMLLSSERERPSLSIMQCYIFSAIYLWNASFFNLAHETLAVAVRAAYALGLHQNSTNHLPQAESHLFQLIWWTLFCLDTKASIELGRPFLIHRSDFTCTLPADNLRKVALPLHLQLTHDGLSYLEYHSQYVGLMQAAQTIHVAFYTKCTELITSDTGKSLHENPKAHEVAAKMLCKSMKSLQDWTRSVPGALKNNRKGNAEPFSTTRAVLEIDNSIPLWLQRQRLFLELLYHNLSMSFNRPFIRSSSSLISLTPVVDNCRHVCLHHATITTDIIYQVLTETALLNGVYQVYQYQWDAMVSLLGFRLFRPICPFASSTSKAIQTGIASLEIIGANNYVSALSAANVARSLSEHIDLCNKSFQNGLIRAARTPSSSIEIPQHDTTMGMPLHLSDISPPFIQAKKATAFSGADSSSISTTGIPDLATEPVTAEEFTAQTVAGRHPDGQLWLMNEHIDLGNMDTNMEMWANWMSDR